MARDEYDDPDDRDRDDRDYDDRPRRRDDRDDTPGDLIAAARRRVKAPAICLIIVGVLYLGFALFGVVWSLVTFDQQWDQVMAQQQAQQQARQQNNPQQAQANQAAQDFMKDFKPVAQVLTYAIYAVIILLAALVIYGATRMLSLSSRGWGMAASIIAIFPLNCWTWVFGIAFGIWGIVALNNPEVKRGFAAKRAGASGEDDYDRRDDRR